MSGTRSTPSERPSRRDGTGPYTQEAPDNSELMKHFALGAHPPGSRSRLHTLLLSRRRRSLASSAARLIASVVLGVPPLQLAIAARIAQSSASSSTPVPNSCPHTCGTRCTAAHRSLPSPQERSHPAGTSRRTSRRGCRSPAWRRPRRGARACRQPAEGPAPSSRALARTQRRPDAARRRRRVARCGECRRGGADGRRAPRHAPRLDRDLRRSPCELRRRSSLARRLKTIEAFEDLGEPAFEARERVHRAVGHVYWRCGLLCLSSTLPASEPGGGELVPPATTAAPAWSRGRAGAVTPLPASQGAEPYASCAVSTWRDSSFRAKRHLVARCVF